MGGRGQAERRAAACGRRRQQGPVPPATSERPPGGRSGFRADHGHKGHGVPIRAPHLPLGTNTTWSTKKANGHQLLKRQSSPNADPGETPLIPEDVSLKTKQRLPIQTTQTAEQKGLEADLTASKTLAQTSPREEACRGGAQGTRGSRWKALWSARAHPPHPQHVRHVLVSAAVSAPQDGQNPVPQARGSENQILTQLESLRGQDQLPRRLQGPGLSLLPLVAGSHAHPPMPWKPRSQCPLLMRTPVILDTLLQNNLTLTNYIQVSSQSKALWGPTHPMTLPKKDTVGIG